MKKTVLIISIFVLLNDVLNAQNIYAQQFYENGQSYFGNGVAVSANGNTVIAGASKVNVSNGGAVVYKRTQNAFLKTGIIAPDVTDVNGLFVNPSVSLSADGKTAILGFWQSKNYHGAFYSGIAFIFHETDTGWRQTAVLLPTAPNPFQAHINYGFGVSISPDGTSAVVGSSTQPNEGKEPGMVYVYKLQNNVWQEVKKIIQSDTQVGYFGSSVQVLDSAKVIAVGDEYYNTSGRAIIFEYDGKGGYNRSQLLAPGYQGFFPSFGYSIAISTDAKTVFVGAPGADNYHGSVCCYKKMDTGWAFHSELFVEDKETNDQFGWSLNLDQNGKTALIGCFPEKFGGIAKPLTGKAYLYQFVNNTWQNTKKIVPANNSNQDGFGSASALASNAATAVIAGPYSTVNAGTQGYIYIYSRNKKAAVKTEPAEALIVKNTAISVFPNPAHNVLNITGLDKLKQYTMQVVRINGNIIAQQKIENLSSYQWNINQLAAGTYILNVTCAGKTQSFRFIKQ